jgi:hypothetical protein
MAAADGFPAASVSLPNLFLTTTLTVDILQKQRGRSMATERVDDIHAFRSFIDEQLASGGTLPTVCEILALWEFENESPEMREEGLESLRRGLADADAGRVVPAREAIAELRRKHRLPELS